MFFKTFSIFPTIALARKLKIEKIFKKNYLGDGAKDAPRQLRKKQ